MARRSAHGGARDHRAHPPVARARCLGAAVGAHRPPPRAHHHDGGAGRDGGGVVPAHRARTRTRADRRREDVARPLDAGRGDRRAAVDSRARAAHRVRDPAGLRRTARARRGHPHVRESADACAPARRVAAAAGGVAEEDDVAQRRRGLDAWRDRPPRTHGVGARPRSGDADARGGGGDRRRACGRVGRGVGEHLAPAAHHCRRRGAAGRTHHEQRRAARHDHRAPTPGCVVVRRTRRPGPHRVGTPGRARAAQREPRLRAAGIARRGPPPSRRAARVTRARRRSRRRAASSDRARPARRRATAPRRARP